jgi:hypothetical protein
MLLLALAVATGLVPGWHGDQGPPAAAFAPARFAPLPTQAVALCRRMPARAVCPARLPRPFITARGRGRPPFRAEVLGVGHGPVGIEFAYSAAVEPPARGWRRHGGNHAWFFWRDERRTYAAGLHVFGRGGERRRLLGRMIRELRPVRELRY